MNLQEIQYSVQKWPLCWNWYHNSYKYSKLRLSELYTTTRARDEIAPMTWGMQAVGSRRYSFHFGVLFEDDIFRRSPCVPPISIIGAPCQLRRGRRKWTGATAPRAGLIMFLGLHRVRCIVFLQACPPIRTGWLFYLCRSGCCCARPWRLGTPVSYYSPTSRLQICTHAILRLRTRMHLPSNSFAASSRRRFPPRWAQIRTRAGCCIFCSVLRMACKRFLIGLKLPVCFAGGARGDRYLSEFGSPRLV